MSIRVHTFALWGTYPRPPFLNLKLTSVNDNKKNILHKNHLVANHYTAALKNEKFYTNCVSAKGGERNAVQSRMSNRAIREHLSPVNKQTIPSSLHV